MKATIHRSSAATRAGIFAIAVLLAACSSGAPTPSVGPAGAASGSAAASASATVAAKAASCDQTGIGDAAQDWPSYGRDYANSVADTAEAQLSSANVSGLAVAWRNDDIGAVTGTPVVIGGIVYFADWHGAAWAVCAYDGSVRWTTQVTDAPISASVAVTDTRVIVADLGGALHALDRETGTVEWSVKLSAQGGSLFASPVVIGDRVIVGMTVPALAGDDMGSAVFRASMVALDVATGDEAWRFYTDPSDGSGGFVPIWSSVAYDPDLGLIYVGTGNPHTQTNGRSTTDLPLSDGVLALHADTGKQAWFYRLVAADSGQDFDVGGSPNLFSVGDRAALGVGGKSGAYAVLDRETGHEIWKTSLTAGSAIGGVMSTAAVADGVIYVGSNAAGAQGTIFALRTDDGSTLWSTKSDDLIVGGSMALANGVLYRSAWKVPRPMGTVLALDAATGDVLWSDDVAAPLAGGISISAGTLFVGYGSGTTPPLLMPADGGLIAYRLPG